METTSTSIVFNNKSYKVRQLLPAALFCYPISKILTYLQYDTFNIEIKGFCYAVRENL